jgi:hypothetical protein
VRRPALPQRLVLYALIALPLIALAVFVRIRHDNVKEPPAPASAATATYMQAVGAACDRATRAAARSGRLSVRLLEDGLKALNPALGYFDHHQRTLDALRVARNARFDSGLVDQFDDAAAVIGAVDCIITDNARPQLAYPPAPKRAGRTTLSWDAFDAEIDGICADNSARTVDAVLRLRRMGDLTEGQKNFAIYHLGDASHRRLVRLFSRLGQPPDDSRPYQKWIQTVTARAHAFARQADARTVGQARELDGRIAQLNGDENWYGRQMGLRVCSAG